MMAYVDRCLLPEVEGETCIIPFYQTKPYEREKMVRSLSRRPDNNDIIAIHWKIEVADERNGWFDGRAIHYQISTHSLHVIVESSTDSGTEGCNGYVAYDYRAIRLIQCLDNYSFPLFNKILRDHIIPIHWEIDYFFQEFNISSEETSGVQCVPLPEKKQYVPDSIKVRDNITGGTQEKMAHPCKDQQEFGFGTIRITASYYSCANNLLVIRNDSARNGHHHVDTDGTTSRCRKDGKYLLIYADSKHVSLFRCLDSDSLYSEFKRLIIEEHIPASLDAQRQINLFPSTSICSALLNSLSFKYNRIQKTKFTEYNDKGIQVSFEDIDPIHHSCVICLENEVCNEVFVPCGHQPLCSACCKIMLKSENESFPRNLKCPICRNVVRSTMKIYVV